MKNVIKKAGAKVTMVNSTVTQMKTNLCAKVFPSGQGRREIFSLRPISPNVFSDQRSLFIIFPAWFIVPFLFSSAERNILFLSVISKCFGIDNYNNGIIYLPIGRKSGKTEFSLFQPRLRRLPWKFSRQVCFFFNKGILNFPLMRTYNVSSGSGVCETNFVRKQLTRCRSPDIRHADSGTRAMSAVLKDKAPRWAGLITSALRTARWFGRGGPEELVESPS